MQSHITASLPLAKRYIAKHFEGRLDKTIRRLGMCSSSSYTLVGWQAGGCSFSAPWLLSCGVVLERKLHWQQRWKKDKGAIFSYQTRSNTSVYACVCSSVPVPVSVSPSKKLSDCPHTNAVKLKEEFMLPMPTLSIKLIRLRAPDTSIISDSFNTNPPCNYKSFSHTKLPDTALFPNSPS